ncbi:MAG TPA: lysylphosphatidylglycerol synthase transmembrane domain-containing protein [Thermotogota bacterium]|nr:lysylphosphatidylglycerol synthase transmembrane domain-containing protein [Thermotogota bacterium]HRW91953.1 lysylphosphatidylglycerol synthase transmembrane domain-containing protein [Thermotogota bacterium]
MEQAKKYLRGFFLAFLFGSTIIVVACGIAGFSETRDSLQTYDWRFALAGFALVLFGWLSETWALQLSVSFLVPLRFFSGFKIALITHFFNMLTPFFSGGQPFAVYYLSREGVDFGHSAAAILLKSMVFQLMLSFLGCLALAMGWSGFSPWVRGLGILSVFLNSFLIFLLFFLVWKPAFTWKLVGFFVHVLQRLHLVKNPERIQGKVHQKLAQFHGTAREYRHHPFRITGIFLVYLFQFVLYAFATLLVISGSTRIPVFPVLWNLLLMNGTTTIVPTPGTSGGAEGFFGLFLSGLVKKQQLVATMMVWRICSYYAWLGLSGMVALFFFSRESKSLPPRSD